MENRWVSVGVKSIFPFFFSSRCYNYWCQNSGVRFGLLVVDSFFTVCSWPRINRCQEKPGSHHWSWLWSSLFHQVYSHRGILVATGYSVDLPVHTVIWNSPFWELTPLSNKQMHNSWSDPDILYHILRWLTMTTTIFASLSLGCHLWSNTIGWLQWVFNHFFSFSKCNQCLYPDIYFQIPIPSHWGDCMYLLKKKKKPSNWHILGTYKCCGIGIFEVWFRDTIIYQNGSFTIVWSHSRKVWVHWH